MRIAFVDLWFSWPPIGGAQANMFHTIEGLRQAGHEVRLFAPVYDDLWHHAGYEPEALPFPSEPVTMNWARTTARGLCQWLRPAVDAWRPDVVFMGFGRYCKPYLIEALAHYPIISRYFLYEHLCIRDGCLYKDYETCLNDFLRTPNVCRKCTVDFWEDWLKQSDTPPDIRDLTNAGVLTPRYHRLFVESLGKCRAAVVNNAMAKERIDDYCPVVRVIPSGVKVKEREYLPLRDKPARERKVILMSGRTTDPLKGMQVLADAGSGLARYRSDFEIWVTGDDDPFQEPWFKACGWQGQGETMDLYREADIVVVPSVWAEPFGRVAVEGMAAGRPVVASRIGGLQEIVRPGETGELFEANSSAELALILERMLDNPEECARMGDRARETAANEYDWEHIVEAYYLPLLEQVTS